MNNFSFFCKGLSLLKIIHRTSLCVSRNNNKANNIKPIHVSISCFSSLFASKFCRSVAKIHGVLPCRRRFYSVLNSSRLLRMFLNFIQAKKYKICSTSLVPSDMTNELFYQLCRKVNPALAKVLSFLRYFLCFSS